MVKSSYGLEQWNHNLTKALLKLKFKQSQYDCSLFTKKTDEGTIIILLYVDDMLITSSSLKLIEDAKKYRQQAFKIKDLERVEIFLRHWVSKSKVEITMYLRKYALELISEIGLSVSKPVGTPIDVNVKLTLKQYND